MLGNTIKLFYNELQPYIDFDFIDCINYDQPYHEKEYHVYLAELKKKDPFLFQIIEASS